MESARGRSKGNGPILRPLRQRSSDYQGNITRSDYGIRDEKGARRRPALGSVLGADLGRGFLAAGAARGVGDSFLSSGHVSFCFGDVVHLASARDAGPKPGAGSGQRREDRREVPEGRSIDASKEPP